MSVTQRGGDAMLRGRTHTHTHTHSSQSAAETETALHAVTAGAATVADLGGVRGVRPHPPWRPSEKFMVYQFRKQ